MRAGKIAIIGGGRVGRTLGYLLRRQGERVGAVVTRSRRTALQAIRFIGAGMAQDRISPATLESKILLIATPDETIQRVAEELASVAGKEGLQGRIVLHTSGARSSSDLACARRAGAAVGSLHPLQTLPGSRPARPDSIEAGVRGVWFAVEGDPAAVRVAERMVGKLGGIPFRLPAGRKANYHAAATVASPMLMAIAEMAGTMMARSTGRPGDSARALMPLMRQTLENWARLGAHKAWTGPFVRGDVATIRAHWRALKGYPAAYRRAYRALAELSIELMGRPRRRARPGLQRVLRKVWR